MELNSGRLKILGDQLGVKMDILEFKKERTFLEFKVNVFGAALLTHGRTILEIKQSRMAF